MAVYTQKIAGSLSKYTNKLVVSVYLPKISQIEYSEYNKFS